MKTEASIEIDKPIEEVFEFTTKHVPEWSLVVVEDEMIEDKPEGMGSTFRVVTEERGRRMEFAGVVTKHEPPTAHTVVMKGRQFDIEAEYRFEDHVGRTVVSQRSIVTAKGFTKVMFALLGWLMVKSSCKALENELENLKKLAEARE